MQEDTLPLCEQGYEVDDDNEPALENIPDATQPELPDEQQWGWDGIDHWKKHNFTNVSASLHGFSTLALSSMSWVAMFLLFFPKWFILDVIIPETNKALVA